MSFKVTNQKLLLLIVMLFSVQLSGKSIYVAKNGSDTNNGSINKPYKTIQKASDKSSPGDVIYIRRGIYKEGIRIKKGGRSGKFITFTAYPGDEKKAIIDGRTFFVFKSSYIKISNLRIQNVTSGGLNQGIYVEGPASNIVIENNHTFNTGNSGIGVWGVAFGENPKDYKNIRNVKILNNKVEKACNGGFNECITLANGIIDFKIIGNEVFNGGDPINGGEGIDIKGGIQNGVIARNRIHGLNRRGIYLDGNGSAKYKKAFVKNVKVFNNICYRNKGHGMAIMTEGVGDVYDIDVYNNLFYDSKVDDGFMIFEHPDGSGLVYNIRVFNNTMYNNKRHGFLLSFPGAYNIKVFNNILYKNGVAAGGSPIAGKEYKVVKGKAKKYNNLIAKNPKFKNENKRDFHLKDSSPAINKATKQAPKKDFDKKSRSGAPDIGAYEN